MVLQKKSDYGFNGYRAPELPQASRPIRKKRSNLRRNVNTDRMGAMDLLATVAGMLLVEKGKPPTLSNGDQNASVSKDIATMDKPLGVNGKPIKVEQCYQASCDEGGTSIGGGQHGQTTSGSVTSGSSSVKCGSDEVARKDGKVAAVKKEEQGTEVLMGKATPLEDHMDLDGKPPALVSSDSSVDVPCRDHAIPCDHSSPRSWKDVKPRDQHGDDDENSSACTHPGPIALEPFRFGGDRRDRKLCPSKFWKVGPTLLKEGEFFGRDVDAKPMFRSRKMCCTRQRTQRTPFKRRKLHERSSAPAKVVVEKGVKVEESNSAVQHGGDGTPPFITKPKSSPETEDYKVKLRIKSFKIPELGIEMPENATVGFLKRTVLETVTAMLGNGLRVGVVLQGKKVRDDNRTLQQVGITCGEKLDSLGFTLEATPSQAAATLQLFNESPPLLSVPTCEYPKPLARLPALPTSDAGVVLNAKPDANEPRCELGSSSIEHGDPDPTTSTKPSNSKAVVPVAASASAEPLALVPQAQGGGKPRRTEVSQRRIRRPFSVAEVEALVQAVEKLGTGRWRDVKLRAFDDAKHRTYVDLKGGSTHFQILPGQSSGKGRTRTRLLGIPRSYPSLISSVNKRHRHATILIPRGSSRVRLSRRRSPGWIGNAPMLPFLAIPAVVGIHLILTYRAFHFSS